MATTSVEKRFIFHASAVALAAQIRRPEQFFVPAVASTCLPVTGGIGRADAPGESFSDVIAYDAASTSVFGDFADREKAMEFTHGNYGESVLPTVTIAEGRITGLRITNDGRVFRAGEMETRMESFADRESAPRFHTLSANFQGLTVDGVGLNVATQCDVFSKYDTEEKLRRAFEEDEEVRAAHTKQFFSDDPALTGPTLADGIVYGTIVSSLMWDGRPPKGAVIAGNRVTIDGFGSLYFGEILIEEGFRRVTLLRFQLGSGQGGEGAAVDVQSNGTGWPPRR